MATATTDALAQTGVFGGCDPTTLAWLGKQVTEHRYQRHDVVFREGEPGDWLFVVAEGAIKLQLASREGDVVVLTTLEPFDCFGELALLDGGPRSATAEALTDSLLLGVTREVLLQLIRQEPQVADRLLRSIGGSLRRLTAQLADSAFLDLPGRVAKLLLALAGQHPSPTAAGDGPAVVELQLTQTELAHMVAGTRQSVNRILANFESRGLLEMQGRTIVIRRPDLLARRAGT